MQANELFPLSSIQTRYFYSSLNGAAHWLPIGLKFDGCIDLVKLQGALDQVVNKHMMLRTAFDIRDGTPMQFISSDANTEIRFVGNDESDLATKIKSTLLEAARATFTLESKLQLYYLFEDWDGRSIFVAMFHHLIFDAVSFGIFVRDLNVFFNCGQLTEISGKTYFDYALSEREDSDREIASNLDFWIDRFTPIPIRRTFAGAISHAEPSIEEIELARIPFEISDKAADEFRKLCASHRTTVATGFLALYAKVIAELSETQDVVITWLSANRYDYDLHNIIGPFTNPQPLRMEIRATDNFSTLFEVAKHSALEAITHPIPYDRLVSELEKKGASKATLSQARLNMLPALSGDLIWGDTRKSALYNIGLPGRWQIDIELSIRDTGAHFYGLLHYNRNLLTKSFADRFVGGILSCFDTLNAPYCRLGL